MLIEFHENKKYVNKIIYICKKNINMLKIGVIGVGHLGKIHLKCIKEIKNLDLVGFFDTDEKIALDVEKEFNVKYFNSLDTLIDNVDIIDIVTPTVSHYDYAKKALHKIKHVFIEKPLVENPTEAKELIDISNEAGVKVQAGYVERFNPAFTFARPYIKEPIFIETHRLSSFHTRGTDVSVILDLMIHDIDIVLSIVKSNIKKISSNGFAIVSKTPDIANARLTFDNGCVANLTASRISMKNMRKSRFFQRDAYISVDFLNKKVEIIKRKDNKKDDNIPFAMKLNLGDNSEKEIIINKPVIKDTNAIKDELESFTHTILYDENPVVSINDGYSSLDIAYQIIEKLNL